MAALTLEEAFADVLGDAPQPAHARLSPSGSHRWINCPGSIEATEHLGGSNSSYWAAEGTAAHALAERCGRSGADAADFLGDTIKVEGYAFDVDDEMAAGVQMYLDTVRADAAAFRDGELSWERRLPLPFLPGEQFGTSDATLHLPAHKLLRVYDLKFGQGIAVSPVENTQQLLYAGGSVVALTAPVTQVELVIIQPRAFHPHGPVRRWTLSTVDLMDRLADIAAAGERALTPGAPRNPGDWCRFCEAAGDCPDLTAASLAEAQMIFGDEAPAPRTMTNEQVGRHLAKATMIRGWITALEERVQEALLAGEDVPGWKLVEKRAMRRWNAHPDDVIAKLQTYGLTLDAVAPRELVSPAKTDKLLNPRMRKEVAEALVVKRSSGLTVAPEHDARRAVAAGDYVGEDFSSALAPTADE